MVSDAAHMLLFVEPPASSRSTKPLVDDLTKLMDLVLLDAIPGAALGMGFEAGVRYRGVHATECGKMSSNQDYLTRGDLITHSLASYYLSWYRPYLPVRELDKIIHIREHYEIPNATLSWKKKDIILFFLSKYAYYLKPTGTLELHRGSSLSTLRAAVQQLKDAWVLQREFFSASGPDAWGVMMDKGPRKFQHLAMLAHFDHQGWRIDGDDVALMEQKIERI